MVFYEILVLLQFLYIVFALSDLPLTIFFLKFDKISIDQTVYHSTPLPMTHSLSSSLQLCCFSYNLTLKLYSPAYDIQYLLNWLHFAAHSYTPTWKQELKNTQEGWGGEEVASSVPVSTGVVTSIASGWWLAEGAATRKTISPQCALTPQTLKWIFRVLGSEGL